MRTNTARRLASLLVGAILALTLSDGFRTGVDAQTNLVTVRFALVPTEVDSLAYYAEDLGYFKEVGINGEVAPLGNGGAIVAAVAGGSIDVGFSNTIALILAHDNGIPFNIIFGTDVYRSSNPTEGILAVPKSSPIHDARELTGKTIAVGSLSNTAFYALRSWIDDNGGDSKNVHYVELPLLTVADAVISGRVDAALMDSANMNVDRSVAGLRPIAYTYNAIAPKFLAGGWFIKPSWYQEHPEIARGVVAALNKAAVWANAHPAEAISIYAKHSKFTVAELQATPRPYYDTSKVEPLLEPMIKLATRYGLIKSTFPVRDLVSPLAD